MNCETFHYDNARTGWFQRTNGLVNSPSSGRPWGKYLDVQLGSPVRGAVMFLQDWTLQAGPQQGQTHTMLYVATSGNVVFAFSEEQLRSRNSAPVWRTPLAPPSNRSGSNIPPPVGVCSTVVLDPANRRLFVLALTGARGGSDEYRIYSLHLDTGQILAQAALSDPGTSGRATFVPSDHDQRGALSLMDGRVYAIFAAFRAYDELPYRGWLVGCDSNVLNDQWFLPIVNRVQGGGIWGPGGAAADTHNNLYVVTGNSPDVAPTRDDDEQGDSYWDGLASSATHPGDYGDFFEAVVRVAPSWELHAGRWDNPVQIPHWFGSENQGGGIAISDLNGDGLPELIVFHIDHPSGGNHGYYRIGWGFNSAGQITGGWSNPIPIPGWFGSENQGGGIAVADLDGDGKPELIVFHIDHPSGGNHGYYRIGWGLSSTGVVAGTWSDPVPIPGWFGSENQGGGIAVADLNGDGKPELVVFHIDHPTGGNHGYYRIGWGLNSAGFVSGTWSEPVPIPGWFGSENQGGGIALADLDGSGRPDLIVFHIDHPSGGNHGYYRVGREIDTNGIVGGGWIEPTQVPGWFGSENQVGAISVADLDGNGVPDFVVFHIDHPAGGNHGYYRIGWNMQASRSLAALDWYLPTDARCLNNDDQDLGGSSALLLPITIGGRQGGELLVTSDKNGTVYLLNSLNLGHWGGEVWKSKAFHAEARSAPAYYRSFDGRHLVFLSAHCRPGLLAFLVENAGSHRPKLAEAWRARDRMRKEMGLHVAAGSPIVVSTNGAERFARDFAMLWILDGGGPLPDDGQSCPVFDNSFGKTLYAYNALDGAEIYSSDWEREDALASVPHYPPISCSEHSVFVGTDSGLACYRLPRIGLASRPQFAVFHIDNPSGGNHGYCRMGWDVNSSGNPLYWDPPSLVPGWFGSQNQAGSIAAADLNGDGNPELIVFHIDHPSDGNLGYYRIGWNPNLYGQPSWSDPIQIPGWFGSENQGGGIAIADLDGDGVPELIVFHIDHPSGGNRGYYRIGWGLNSSGQVTGQWTEPVEIPGWFGSENQGGGIAVADLNGDGMPELVVFHIDHPSGGNRGYYRIGWGLNSSGVVTGTWSEPIAVPGWFGSENQGGGIAVADLNSDGVPEFIVFHIDNPSGGNNGYYRVGWALNSAGVITGSWSAPIPVPGWFGDENQGGGITLLHLPWSWVWPTVAPGRGERKTMSHPDNKALVRRLYQELNKGNFKIVDELYAPNYIAHIGSRTSGIREYKEYLENHRSAFPDWHTTIEAIYADGDVVIVRVIERGIQKGPWKHRQLGHIAPTHKPVSASRIIIRRFRDGKVVESWINADHLGMLEQLGTLPAANNPPR